MYVFLQTNKQANSMITKFNVNSTLMSPSAMSCDSHLVQKNKNYNYAHKYERIHASDHTYKQNNRNCIRASNLWYLPGT
jgi:hypothetical protein